MYWMEDAVSTICRAPPFSHCKPSEPQASGNIFLTFQRNEHRVFKQEKDSSECTNIHLEQRRSLLLLSLGNVIDKNVR